MWRRSSLFATERMLCSRLLLFVRTAKCTEGTNTQQYVTHAQPILYKSLVFLVSLSHATPFKFWSICNNNCLMFCTIFILSIQIKFGLRQSRLTKKQISLALFRCTLFAIIIAILCACSLWRKRRQICGWGSPRPHSQSGDSAGSCYAPPQYSRCTSFHHAPPPYAEVEFNRKFENYFFANVVN